MTRTECLAFERAVLALLGYGERRLHKDGITSLREWVIYSADYSPCALTLFRGSSSKVDDGRESFLFYRWHGLEMPTGFWFREGTIKAHPSDPRLAAQIARLGFALNINEVSP